MIEKIINVKIIKNPFNWVIVFLMIALGGMLIAMVSPQSNGNGR